MINLILAIASFLGLIQHAQALTIVHLGLASNFSDVSTSTSNPFGNYFRDGVSLALEQANQRLNKAGIIIVTREFDYGTEDIRAAAVASAAADSDVVAVIGYNWSSHALIAAPVHQRRRLPMISPSASANRLSELGDFVHTSCFSNAFMGWTLADVARTRLKADNAAIVVTSDCAYCRDLAEAFRREFQATGGAVSITMDVLGSDNDFSVAAEALKKANPDVVLVPNQELVSARIISSLLKAGVKKPFLGGDGWGDVGQQFFQILGGQPLEGYSVSHWHPALTDKRSTRFKSAYEERFRKTPNDTSVLAFDATNFFIEALLAAKSIDRQGIEAALDSIHTLEGVTGKFLFETNRAPRKSIVLLKNGASRFEIADQIPPNRGQKK